MNMASRLGIRLRRTFTWYFSGKIVLALLIVAVSATSIVTSTTYQAEIGGELNVTNRLIAVDKGIFVASSSVVPVGTSCSNPTIFGGGTVANIGITQQDLVYDVQVNETLATSINTCYKAALVVTPNGGAATTYGPVYMNSSSSILSTFQIDCEFDIGASAPSSPYSFQLTVQ